MLHFLYTVQVKIHTKYYCMKPEMMQQWPLLSSEIYPTLSSYSSDNEFFVCLA